MNHEEAMNLALTYCNKPMTQHQLARVFMQIGGCPACTAAMEKSQKKAQAAEEKAAAAAAAAAVVVDAYVGGEG